MALSDNLVAYYKLDGNSNDSAGSNNGTDNTISYVAGKIGNAASFNGSPSAITAGNLGISGIGALSISFWVKIDADISNGQLYGFVGLSSNITATRRFQCYYYNNSGTRQIVFDPSGGGGFLYNINLGTTNYYHIVIVRNPATGYAYLYVNGSLAGSQVLGSDATDYGEGFGAGITVGGGNNLKGKLDEIGVWDRVITSTEVGELYNSGDGYNGFLPSGNTSNFFKLF